MIPQIGNFFIVLLLRVYGTDITFSLGSFLKESNILFLFKTLNFFEKMRPEIDSFFNVE